jgi:hypothetical protein
MMRRDDPLAPKRLAEYATKAAIRVELYTRNYHVSGDVEVNRWRLADVLNDRSQPFVLLVNAVREPLPVLMQTGGAESARAAKYLQIVKDAIVFAIPQESPELEAVRQQYLSALYSERAQVEALALAPPFQIQGTVHLRRIVQPRRALEDLPPEFIPMTHMEASYFPDQRLRVTADLAVINRPLAEVFAFSTDGVIDTSRGFRRGD